MNRKNIMICECGSKRISVYTNLTKPGRLNEGLCLDCGVTKTPRYFRSTFPHFRGLKNGAELLDLYLENKEDKA